MRVRSNTALSKLLQPSTLGTTGRMPGLRRSAALPPLHLHRHEPPPKKPRIPTDIIKPPADSDASDAEPEPEPDWENEGFL